MTPLAHRIVKELTLPVKDRTFNDNLCALPKLASAHCFEVSDVKELAYELGYDVARRGVSLDETTFLPAPLTWIEFQQTDVKRVALLLEDLGDGRALVSAFDDDACMPVMIIRHGAGMKFTYQPTTALLDADWPIDTACGLIGFLAIINSPRLIGRQQHMPHRGLEKRLAKAKGLVGKFPLHGWTEIKLSVADIGKRADGTTHEAHYTGEKCLHFCRAHLRIRNGRLERVSAHWRGNPALGMKQSRYKLAA